MKTMTFPHGIHPQELKEATCNKPLQPLPAPEKVIIPLHQHFGSPAEPLVKKGDEVLMGQKIGESKSFFSACVHSSVSGKVMKVENYNHPSGNPVPAVTISNDGEDRVFPDIKEHKDPMSLNPEKIRHIVKDAGIVGLGGAAFPTAVKLSPPKDKPIDTIIINGCECEPVLTADHRLMLEYPDDIIQGAELVRITTGAEKIILGIENNKQVVYKLDVPKEFPEFYKKIYERMQRKGEFEIIEFRKRAELKPWIKPVLKLMNECYSQSDIYGYTPLEEEEMQDLAKRYLPLLDPRFVKGVKKGDEVVSFIVGMPNFTEGIRKAKGRLLPFGIFRIMRAAKKTKQLDLLLGAVKEKYRGRGLDVFMGVKMLMSAHKAGLELIDTHHEMETNTKVRAEMEKMGGVIYKRFRVYKKQL